MDVANRHTTHGMAVGRKARSTWCHGRFHHFVSGHTDEYLCRLTIGRDFVFDWRTIQPQQSLHLPDEIPRTSYRLTVRYSFDAVEQSLGQMPP